MTRDEAEKHLGLFVRYAVEDEVRHVGRGTIVGIVDQPSVLVEFPSGARVAFPMDRVAVLPPDEAHWR